MRNLLLFVLAAALAVPAASAHVTITAEGPAAPVAAGVPFVVTATASALCPVVVGEYQALGETELYFGVPPDAPAYVTVSEQQVVPFSAAQCSLDGYAYSTGTFTAVLGPEAPGLTELALAVVAYGNDPSTPEGGDPALVPVTVAHFANATLTAKPAEGEHEHHAGEGKTTIELVLDYTTNAESLLTFEATSSSGEVHEVEAVSIDPPSFSNQSRVQATVYAAFMPPANWTEADLTFTAFLTPKGGGPRIEVATANVTVANGHAGHDAEAHGEHEHADEQAPAPALALMLLAVVAVAAVRHRA